ncbi:MAG: TolC family protein [Candidatus Symbiothrix sp.]|jgi:outer membrane protein TolC|nr:TolC family protein [Candidatus Symbiothrix sp.]
MKHYFIILLLIPCSLIIYGQEDSLIYYLRTAAENSPAVKAAFHSYEAALQKVPQMGAWQDPQLEMGFFLEPMDLVDGREIAQFQLMQMFPWFGTQKAARTEAQQMAKMAFEAFREAKDNLYLEIYTQWYLLCTLQQKLQNSETNRQLLKQVESLAVQRFASGGSDRNAMSGEREKPQTTAQTTPNSNGMAGMNMGANSQLSTLDSQLSTSTMNMSGGTSSAMSEILRIQLEVMDLDNSIASLQSEIAAEKARFNLLLNRPIDSKVQIPSELIMNDLLLDESSSMSLIQAQNPMLGMLHHESLAYEAQADMNRKMGYPMFGIGLQYMLIGKSPEQPSTGHGTPTMNEMNGQDMIMPMVSLSIPLYRNKYRAAQKESRLLKQASEEKFQDTFNRLQADFIRLKHELNDERRKIELFKKQQDLAQTTYELVLQEFASGKSDLSAVIQVQRQLLNYQLNTAESIAAYNTKIANIQKLISQ